LAKQPQPPKLVSTKVFMAVSAPRLREKIKLLLFVSKRLFVWQDSPRYVSDPEFDRRGPHAYKQASKLIQQTLRLWVGARGLEDSWHISRVQVSNGWTDLGNRVPLTPILRYQVETVLQLQILKPLESKILRDLDKMWLELKGENWTITFLTTFILLHNCDLIMAQHRRPCQIRNAQVRISLKAWKRVSFTNRRTNTPIKSTSAILILLVNVCWHVFTASREIGSSLATGFNMPGVRDVMMQQ